MSSGDDGALVDGGEQHSHEQGDAYRSAQIVGREAVGHRLASGREAAQDDRG